MIWKTTDLLEKFSSGGPILTSKKFDDTGDYSFLVLLVIQMFTDLLIDYLQLSSDTTHGTHLE